MNKLPHQLKGCEIILLLNGDATGDPEDFKRSLHKWKEEKGGYRFTVNKEHLSKYILPHLRAGGGYAVYCSNGLIAIDCDEPELEELVQKELPETFTVRTGSGGLHYYYSSDLGEKIVLHKEVEGQKENKHLGEIQAGGDAYVVGPGSKHPNGNYYEVEKDLPIAELPATQINDFIKRNGLVTSKVRRRTKEEVKKDVKELKKRKTQESLYYNIGLSDVGGLPDNPKGDGSKGSHPMHGSKTGGNYHIAGDECWFCFRHWTGGGPLEFIAMKEGLLDCSEIDPDLECGMDDDSFVDVVIAAHKNYGVEGKPPSRAIKTVALREGYCKPEDVKEGWKVPQEAYNKVLEWFESQGVKVPRKNEKQDKPVIEFENFDVEVSIYENKLYAQFINKNDKNDRSVKVYLGASDSSYYPKDTKTKVRAALESVNVSVNKGEPDTIIFKVKKELQDEELRKKATVDNQKQKEEQQTSENKFTEEELKQARELIQNPYWLRFVKRTLDKKVTGENDNKMLLFLLCCSKEIDPQASYLIAESSTGKSYLVLAIKPIFEEDFIWFTRITPSALDRIGADLTGKIFVIGEDGGVGEGAAMLRQWISEGKLRLLTVEKNENGNIVSTEHETTGKPVVISTTTRANIDSELATRIWVMNPDTSKEQTGNVLYYEAEEADGTRKDYGEQDIRIIKAALQELKSDPVPTIYIPYAKKMAEKFPKANVRARRDFKKILSLIKVSAWLHQRNRPVFKTDEGRVIIATPADLYLLKSIVLKSIKPTLTGLSDIHEVILNAVQNMEGTFTAKEVYHKLPQYSVKTLREKLNDLERFGYLQLVEGGRGKTNKYEVINTGEYNSKDTQGNDNKKSTGQMETNGDAIFELSYTQEELNTWLENNLNTWKGVSGGSDIFFKYSYDPLKCEENTPPPRPGGSRSPGSTEQAHEHNNENKGTEMASPFTAEYSRYPVDYEPIDKIVKCDACGVERGTVLKITYDDGSITYEHPACLESNYPTEIKAIKERKLQEQQEGREEQDEEGEDELSQFELEEDEEE